MRLSELHTGESAVIVKVYGHGGFRKRIIEMGFVKGNTIRLVHNAPLRDPIEFELLGYKISLRRAEAEMVEVVSESEAQSDQSLFANEQLSPIEPSEAENKEIEQVLLSRMEQLATEKQRTINVALVGNPNCGKTSLFNIASGAHEHVGNYSGVTVDAKEGFFDFDSKKQNKRYRFRLVDLPGTYSLSAYSPEELYVRRHLLDVVPDVVINVVDASNIERNMYLTTQLIDMNLRLVIALNMYDELIANGDKLNHKELSTLLGAPIVPTISRTGDGVEQLFEKVIDIYESNCPEARHIHINHGSELEQSIDRLKIAFQKNQNIRFKYSTRYLAIKFLENDRETNKFIDNLSNHDELVAIRYDEHRRLSGEFSRTTGCGHGACASCSANCHRTESPADSVEAAIIDAKYGFVRGALKETFFPSPNKKRSEGLSDKIDAVVTNQWLGFPIFFLLLFLIFEGTFVLGDYPMQWIEWGTDLISRFVQIIMPQGILKDMIIDGIIGGVGSVIVFLPNILLLYLFISLLEDSGYMARAAFIMDKLMHRMGLHGKSFIPMIMGFGCNVPAIMATRTIENPKSRIITMLVTPFMSCSARLPIYIIIIGAFFPSYASLVMLGLYLFGIIIAVISARIFSKFIMKGVDMPFVMELPPYRIPTAKSIFRHTWEKGRQYLRKMAGIILFASIIIWALGYFPLKDERKPLEEQPSYLETIGKTMAPALSPQGFNWKMSVSILSGISAKELVVSTLGIMYSGDYQTNDDDSNTHLQNSLLNDISPAAALAYLIFVLLYFPCIATVVAISKESGHWKWAAFNMLYTTTVAWILSALVYQLAQLII